MVTPASSLSLPVHRTGAWNLPRPSLRVCSARVPGSLTLCLLRSGGRAGKAPRETPTDREEGEERQGLKTAGSHQPLLFKPLPLAVTRQRDDMESSLVLLLALAMAPFQLGSGQSLHVDPPDPVVAVAKDTTLRLNCSLPCDEGVAQAQWRGLDTHLGNVQNLPGSSILSIHGLLTDAGTRLCVGSCGGRSFQHSVQIIVYGEAHSALLGATYPGVSGPCTTPMPSPTRSPHPRPTRLTHPPFLSQTPKAHSCIITPTKPTSSAWLSPGPHLPSAAFPDQLAVSWSGQDQEVSCTAHNIWPPGLDILSFTLLLGDQRLEGARALEPEQEEETQEAEGTPLLRVTQRWLLPSLETPAPPALYCQVTMQLPSLVLTHKRGLPVLQSWTSPEPPNTTSAKPYILTSSHTTEASSTGLPNSTTLPSTPPHSTLSPRTLSSAGTCYPEIHQDQEAVWQLLCEASCGPGVTVRWILAPGNLSAYHKREAGAQAWLSVPPPGPIPEGWFQCRLDPGGQAVSLYVSSQVFPKPSSDITLWIGSLALGLLALAFLAYRLWKRYGPSVPPDTSSCTLL
ncbi:mucosal addressin cell adhesion molecule 1 isoform X1 [Peromyscus californicus insignis]|uniref:mucosal addressin cell adhesion molecule 1 isoform X1 n=1 Tax=Peromyscus californicus insignis TaxID=564181 RepID=UPI0022A7D3F9|nr:mucosal addressin cell adhesion molecule 1 isoform X1 [Peromyscus californicus insignis]